MAEHPELSAQERAGKAFPVSWDQFHRDCRALTWRLNEVGPFHAVVAITRGGLVPAARLLGTRRLGRRLRRRGREGLAGLLGRGGFLRLRDLGPLGLLGVMGQGSVGGGAVLGRGRRSHAGAVPGPAGVG